MANKNTVSNDWLINIVLTLAVSLGSLCAGELLLRALPLSDRLGWNRVPPFSKRIEQFNLKAKTKIVCLGNSFAIWRAGEGVNMFDYAQKSLFSKGCAILNLGVAGTTIEQYMAIYNTSVRFKPDGIIMCLYLGNDIYNYSSLPVNDAMPIDEGPGGQGWKSFFKRHSILANLIFRFGKEHIPFLRSGFFEGNIKELQKSHGLSSEVIQSRIKQIDPRLLTLAKSDAINSWILAQAIAHPAYYKDLFALRSQDAFIAADETVAIIEKFYRKQGLRDFFVVLLPESIQVSEKYDYFFKQCGFDLDDFPLPERRKVTLYIQKKLNESGIRTLDTTAALASEENVFINLDTHLNAKGHKIVGTLITRFIESQLYPPHTISHNK